MKKFYCVGLIIIMCGLTACKSEAKSISWLTKHPEEREAILKDCMEHVQNFNSERCTNAVQAGGLF